MHYFSRIANPRHRDLVKRYHIEGVRPEWGFTMKQDWAHENGMTLEELDVE